MGLRTSAVGATTTSSIENNTPFGERGAFDSRMLQRRLPSGRGIQIGTEGVFGIRVLHQVH